MVLLAMLAGAPNADPAATGGNAGAGAGAITVKFDREAQQRLGMEVKQLAAGKAPREIMTFGRVLDAARLQAQVSERDAAAVSAQLSQQELGRLRQLEDNTSERRMQTAEAEARRDQLALQSARSNLRLTWGDAIAERDDLPDLVQSLVSQAQSLVRLDLPVGEKLAGLPSAARIVPMGAETPVAGTVLGMAPTVLEQNQTMGLLILAPQGDGLLPGAAVTGFLEMPGDPLNGVVIPRAAVVRYAGRSWVYVQIDAGKFARREVALENPLADGWLVSTGLGPGDRIVESGAQLLLSEETKAEIDMED
jgi:hypothetical protein